MRKDITTYCVLSTADKCREAWFRNQKQLDFKFVSRSNKSISKEKKNQMGGLREEKQDL